MFLSVSHSIFFPAFRASIDFVFNAAFVFYRFGVNSAFRNVDNRLHGTGKIVK